MVITSVLGAPGSGKTSAAKPLANLLPTHVVLDWDAFMAPASVLAGREIRANPATWTAYRGLVHAVVRAVARLPVVMLGPCTPEELVSWPIGAWVLLDCTDQERLRRLGNRTKPGLAQNSIDDASEYRSLGLPIIDTTGRSPEEVAAALAGFVRHEEHAGD
jgi:shikimate kinase